MSNYHNQIMNIQMPEDGRIKYNLDEQPDITDVIAYKFGHRDARHAAAEIAAQADEEIDSLKVANSELRGQLDREWSSAHGAENQLAAANQRIAELQARLRAWEETAEHYCAPNTPISADGVRGYIAELEAQLAAANQRIEAMESEFEDAYAAANEMYSVYAHAE